MTISRTGFGVVTASFAAVTLASGVFGQGGEDPGSCTPIPALPFTTSGTTVGFFNDTDEVCPYTGSTSPDVYYCYTPSGDQTVTIDLCESGYDCKVYVYDSSLNLVGCNDDACSSSGGGAFRSLLTVDLTGATGYFIAVDGWNGDAGPYSMIVTTPPPPCVGDLDGDGETGFGDLLTVLSNWGPCPGGATLAPASTSTTVDELFGTLTANVVNQNGLADGYTDGSTDYDVYLEKGPTHDSGPEGNVWLMTGTAGSFDADFGSATTLNSVAIWNKDGLFGGRDFVLLADDEPTFTDATTLVTATLANQAIQAAVTHERFDFTATSAQYYRIQILNNQGAAFTGLSEVVFRAGCVGDVDGDGEVGFGDLLLVLSNWGPCPG